MHSGCEATSDGCQLDDAYPAHSADAAEEVLISDDDDDTNEDHDANTAQDMPIAEGGQPLSGRLLSMNECVQQLRDEEARVSCSTTTAGSWFQSLTVLTANE